MNTNNISQHVNAICGSPDLELLPFYLQSFNLPGISFSLPEHSSRSGTKALFGSDTLTYNQLDFTILIDENYKVYFEFTDKIFKAVNIEKNTFDNNVTFDFFIIMTNNKGKPLFRYDFHNCRIESIGDVSIDFNDDTVVNTFNVSVKYEYYTRSTDQPSILEFLKSIKEPYNSGL